jgi:hypothetical protein
MIPQLNIHANNRITIINQNQLTSDYNIHDTGLLGSNVM